MMKKLFCLFVCVCLLFVGCGAKKTDVIETGNTSTTGVPSDSSADTESSNFVINPSDNCFLTAENGAPIPERTTVDLMQFAIDASTLAETDLKNLPVYGYGTGIFFDYYDLHGDPLYSADYMLGVTALAKQTKDADSFSTFFGEMLAHYGARIEHKTITLHKDLDKALTKLFEAFGDTSNLQNAKTQAQNLDSQMQQPLAMFINAVADASKAIKEQTSKVGEDTYTDLLKFQYYTMTGGDMESLAKMTEAYNAMDFAVILDAGRDVVYAAGVLADALKKIPIDTTFVINTPAGDIIFSGGQDDVYTSPNALLLVDVGGNDTYNGRVASNSFEKPVSVLIDIGGNDSYIGQEATQGCGIMGVGVLMDMDGNDTYIAKYMAQGCAILGLGALYDQNGDDQYTSDLTAQASGHYGMAVLADCAGNDRYQAVSYAQASAGNCCQAYLVDICGDDTYYVSPRVLEEYPGIAYDQYPEFNTNNSQGCGWGQRAVETSERGIAGGIGGLIDISGNDKYEGGVWTMGAGYWGGVGFLTDADGNDTYKSAYYSQASVAHYGVGMMVDIGGDDSYELSGGGSGAGLGFTWDRGLAVLINDGGNDTYRADAYAGGSSISQYDDKGVDEQDMCYAIFLDTEGDDTYSAGDYRSWGVGRGGYFVDAGGNDISYREETTEDNFCITNREAQKGGVYIDYPKADGEAYFWENAKLMYLG